MPEFIYRAKNRQGKVFTGVYAADDIHEAAAAIRSKGLWIVGLDQVQPEESWLEKLKRLLLTDVHVFGSEADSLGEQEAAMVLRELSVMLEAGFTVQQSLQQMARYAKAGAYRKLLEMLCRQVSEGKSLSEAMKMYPQVFSATVRGCISAGEESGSLERLLPQMATALENNLQARQDLREAAANPAFMFVLMLLAMLPIVVYILPEMAKLLQAVNAELPLPAALLLYMAAFIQTTAGKAALVAVCAVLPAGAYALWHNSVSRFVIDRLLLALPGLGSLIRHAEWLQITGTLSVLLGSGLQLARALKMVSVVPSNSYLRAGLAAVTSRVEKGETFSDALTSCPAVPWVVREFLAAGEVAGDLETMAQQAAAYCKNQAKYKQSRLLRMVQPALTLVIGAILFFLVLSVAMPVLNVMDALMQP